MTTSTPVKNREATEFDRNVVEMIRYDNGAIAFKEGGQYGNWIYFYPEQIAAMTAFVNEK